MTQFANPGPRIDGRDIARFEASLDVALPESYRAFLVRSNGGAPREDSVDVVGLEGSPTDVQTFFGIGRAIESSDLAWNRNLIVELSARRDLLPIACDSGGNLFCFRIEGGAARSVVYCDLADPEFATHDVAGSFEEFVAVLRHCDE